MDPWSLLERAFGWGGVVAYHGVGDAPQIPVMHVSPARLKAQLTHLRDRYNVISLRELVSRWQNGMSTRGCTAITFDDAYAGVARHAVPILHELEIPATIFVTSNHAARGGSYWWDDVERRRAAAGVGEWVEDPRTVGLAPMLASSPDAVDRVRRRVLGGFAGRWPGPISHRHDTDWRSMDFEELDALASDPYIDFGVHTLSHPALPLLPYSEQVAEMRDNLAMLRERFSRVQPVVAYPYGLYDRTTVRAAVEAGMIAGLTMEGRATANRPSPMIVPRIGAGDLHEPQSLARRLNRALRPVLVIRNRGSHPRLPNNSFARTGRRIPTAFQTA